jgi:integrase
VIVFPPKLSQLVSYTGWSNWGRNLVADIDIRRKAPFLFKVTEERQPTDLRRALCTIGIPIAEQRRRHLTFHAWRHFLNSMLRSHGVADVKTRRVTGHRTETMTDWYTDWKAIDLSEIVSIQTALLEPPGLAAAG